MRNTGISLKNWIEFMNQPVATTAALNFATASIENPSRAMAGENYAKSAETNATSDGPPITVCEGMQTIANLSRTSADFNPANIDGTGDFGHFIQFTENIAANPILFLAFSENSEVKQQSKNSNVLISSFVDSFIGITQGNIDMVTQSVTSLVNAALSYAGQKQKASNFTQNVLQEAASGDVQFNLYYSILEIVTEESKGTIEFKSEYQLIQVGYVLTIDAWERNKDAFREQESTSLEEWIESMNTPVDPDTVVNTPCLS